MTLRVEALLNDRKSTRGYLSTPVPLSDVQRILTAARRAPSGANLQPGRFYALAGPDLKSLTQTLVTAAQSDRAMVSEYSYFPDVLSPDLKAKQRGAGFALYEALGIQRRDIEGRKKQFIANYKFFDAPVGIVVTIDRDMGKGCFMDLGMALMALFMAAQDMGYATTGIGALANYADVAHEALGLDASEMIVCGIALGVRDPDHPANTVSTERDDLVDFATFKGFQT